MTTARIIITLALESMNKLSPGEAIDPDVGAACLRRLNSIADDWSAGRDMMPQDQIITGSATGTSITLGAGDWTGIAPGEEIVSMSSDKLPMDPITVQQYNAIYLKTQEGRPQFWCADGVATVYLYPAASGNTLSIVTRKPFSSFADLDTAYTMPAGYEGAFAATLAVAMAPVLIGKVTADLVQAKREALANIRSSTVRPAIVNADPLGRARAIGGNILGGWL